MLPGDLLEPVNLIVLRNNAFLEAAVIAAVVLADAGYRRLRRARRRALGRGNRPLAVRPGLGSDRPVPLPLGLPRQLA